MAAFYRGLATLVNLAFFNGMINGWRGAVKEFGNLGCRYGAVGQDFFKFFFLDFHKVDLTTDLGVRSKKICLTLFERQIGSAVNRQRRTARLTYLPNNKP